jgi:hypothetical protein
MPHATAKNVAPHGEASAFVDVLIAFSHCDALRDRYLVLFFLPPARPRHLLMRMTGIFDLVSLALAPVLRVRREVDVTIVHEIISSSASFNGLLFLIHLLNVQARPDREVSISTRRPLVGTGTRHSHPSDYGKCV